MQTKSSYCWQLCVTITSFCLCISIDLTFSCLSYITIILIIMIILAMLIKIINVNIVTFLIPKSQSQSPKYVYVCKMCKYVTTNRMCDYYNFSSDWGELHILFNNLIKIQQDSQSAFLWMNQLHVLCCMVMKCEFLIIVVYCGSQHYVTSASSDEIIITQEN